MATNPPRNTQPPQASTQNGREAAEAVLQRRIAPSPLVTKERLLASLPRVQTASRRLQNATGVRNEEAWPTPSRLASEVDPLSYAANVAALEDAIQGCGMFGVDMGRVTERGKVLDRSVEGLEKREVKTTIQEGKVQEGGTTVKGKGKGKEKEVTDMAMEEQDTLKISMRKNQGSGRGRSEVVASVQEVGSEVW